MGRQRKTTPVPDYTRLRRVDGRHPFRRSVPGGSVDYKARRRHDGAVAYFNFGLAREMGLIPARHPDRLTGQLRRAILDTFGIVIINEFDRMHKTRFPKRDLLPHPYIATRYLQLQHPGRQGRTSGDGRSIWNGTVRHRGVTWDITSCGTGVTRLCPATGQTGRFFKTGSRAASYACGTAALEEGFEAILMSETFHRNRIPTERVLAVIALPDGRSVNVRVGRNLLRPSHFLVHLKQNRIEPLRALADLFIERQVANEHWPSMASGPARYRMFARQIACSLARATATFESEYIFCWLDWDGDNILLDGGIIDYGSVRQFGLYHREYRFEDDARWSTTIPEQRRKARHLVQNFAQIRDFLITGRKPPLASLAEDSVLRLFERTFEETRNRLLLRNVGFEDAQQHALMRRALPAVLRFRRVHRYFERVRSRRGRIRVQDGLSWNAIFSTRDMLRELPVRLQTDLHPIPADDLLRIATSSYASRRDRIHGPYRKRMAKEFQHAYLDLVHTAARHARIPGPALLTQIAARSAVINRFDRITGDSVTYATRKLIHSRKTMSPENLHSVIHAFVEQQDLNPTRGKPRKSDILNPATADTKRLLDRLLRAVRNYPHGL